MILARYLSYLPILIGAAVFFVLAGLLWLAGRRALANSRGGLQWVKEYNPSHFELSKQRLTASKRDLLCLFAVAVFSFVLSAAVAFLRSRFETGSWFTNFYCLSTLCRLLIYAAGAVSVCWLMQDLFRDNTVAVCGGLLFAVSAVGEHTALSLLSVSALLFLRWFVQDDDAPLFPGIFLLLLSDALLALAASRMVSLTWLGLFYLAAQLYKSFRRGAAVSGRTWELYVTPLLGILVWFCSFTAATLGVMLVFGYLQPANISASLLLRLADASLQRIALLPKSIFTAPVYSGLLLYPLADAPLLMLGFFGFFSAVRTAADRRDSTALISAVVLLLLGICWVFGRKFCLLPGLILCGGCLLRRFTAAERKLPVIVYTALSCAYYVMLYLVTYLISASPALAEAML